MSSPLVAPLVPSQALPAQEPRSAPPQAGPPPDSLRLLSLLTAPWIAQSLYVVAKFDVADHLTSGPRDVEDLARATGLHADTLYRIMRTLATFTVFDEVAPRQFALADLGQFLREDVAATQKHSALLFGEETFQAWGQVLHTATTGEPAFDHVFGMPFYDYLEEFPEKADVFNRVMGAAGVVPPVLQGYGFEGSTHVVDLGGGTGELIAAVLARNPHLRGTLVDLPRAVENAPEALTRAGVSDRCSVVAGSFFDSVPSGADAYVLSRVLHNWNDADAVRILRAVREAMADDGVLLVCERLVPSGNVPHIGKMFDLVMLVVLGGRDRTRDEYAALLDAAGFQVTEERSGPAAVGLLVARPARSTTQS